jgi:hypothetical protein
MCRVLSVCRAREKVYKLWQTEFDGADADGGFRCMVMHPQGIGRRLHMAMLERLI